MEIDLKTQQLKTQDTTNNSINNSKVISVNQKVKDSLFKTIYQKEERLTSLAQFLLKLDVKEDVILTDYNLSDSYLKDSSCSNIKPDLELTVHVFDLRMSSYEVCRYIEENYVPERFILLDDTVLKYALTSNSLKYMMMLEKGHKILKRPDNIHTVEDLCELLKARDIFVEIFSDKEARNMIAAQFSREDMIRYAGWEEGLEEGRKEGLEQGLKNIVCNMYTRNYTIEQISGITDMDVEDIKRILNLN